MMNLTLLAAQTAIGDTLAGGNPVLTPVSGEAQMNLLGHSAERRMDYGCTGCTVCGVFLYFL